MLKSHLILAWRQLRKHKAFSLTILLGLAIGMSASLLILQYVRFELSYDDFHPQADVIYRLQMESHQSGAAVSTMPSTYPGMAPWLKSSIAGIDNYVRIVA